MVRRLFPTRRRTSNTRRRLRVRVPSEAVCGRFCCTGFPSELFYRQRAAAASFLLRLRPCPFSLSYLVFRAVESEPRKMSGASRRPRTVLSIRQRSRIFSGGDVDSRCSFSEGRTARTAAAGPPFGARLARAHICGDRQSSASRRTTYDQSNTLSASSHPAARSIARPRSPRRQEKRAPPSSAKSHTAELRRWFRSICGVFSSIETRMRSVDRPA